MSNKKGAIEHLEKHQMYPATREDLITECDGLPDFSKGDKEWFKDNLPSGTYNSAGEVRKVLGL